MRKVIALIGSKRCGKDSVADIMCYAQRFERFQISAQLKDGLCRLYPEMTRDMLETDAKDEVHPDLGTTPRSLLQAIGTDVTFSAIGKQYWVKSVIRRIQESPAERVVITDMRFPHEEEALRKAFPDMQVVRIFREVNTSTRDPHISENSFQGIPYDVAVYNSGTLRDLVWKVIQAVGRK